MERSAHWYVVASSRELGAKPMVKERFGTRFVFWRRDGELVCLPDRCPHRGASLGQGELVDGNLACPYHGFQYDSAGRCVHIPCQPDKPIPSRMSSQPVPVCEQDGWIWMWRGHSAESLPLPPTSDMYAGFLYGETSSTWDAHYVRVLEAQIDYTHVPFVHRTSFGRKMAKEMEVEVTPGEGSFRARLIGREEENFQFIELLYPNVWLNRVGGKVQIISAFAPIDEHRCEMYVRFCQRFLKVPLLGQWIADVGTWQSKKIIREDAPVVAEQRPQAVEDCGEILLKSDATIALYRKMRRRALSAHAEAVSRSGEAARRSEGSADAR